MRRWCGWKIGVALSLALLASAAPASAADTFVNGSTGNDGNGCLSAAQPCATIAAAIPKAAAGDTVHVAEGTYSEPQLITNGRSLAASGSAAATIVDAAAAVPALIVTTGASSSIDGFTIRCAVCSVDQVDVGAPGTIRGNVFDGDSAGTFGDLAVRFGSGAVTVEQNEFTDPDPSDQQQAVHVTSGTSPVIRDNRITGFFLGIEADRGTPVIRGNDIAETHNSGGQGSAIRISSAGTDPIAPTILGNDIHDPDLTPGSAPSGVFMVDTPGPPVKSATLERNRISGHGPGVAAIGTEGSVTMNGDIVSGSPLFGITAVDTTETASPDGPGDVTATNVTSFDNAFDFNLQDTHLTLDSSISSDGVRTLDSAPTDTSTCSITFSRGPAANIGTPPASCDSSQFSTNVDPMFVNAPGGNFHLLATSPMIDAGNPGAPAPGVLDFDGDERALAGTCSGGTVRRDIGADEFVPDCTPPDTQIGGTPADDTLTNSRSASLTFSSTEPGSTFECAENGVDFAPCTSPLELSGLADGDHQLFVRARDAAGNVDATPALHGWRVDGTAPETTIDSGPEEGATTASRDATYAFSSEDGARFECSLDGAPFASCTSPLAISGLDDGAHALEVRAIDLAGNADASPARRTLTVAQPEQPLDRRPPETTITKVKLKRDRAKVRFGADETLSSFECRLDRKRFRPCTSPKTYRHLDQGKHKVSVRATDPAGNVDGTAAKRRFEVG